MRGVSYMILNAQGPVFGVVCYRTAGGASLLLGLQLFHYGSSPLYGLAAFARHHFMIRSVLFEVFRAHSRMRELFGFGLSAGIWMMTGQAEGGKLLGVGAAWQPVPERGGSGLSVVGMVASGPRGSCTRFGGMRPKLGSARESQNDMSMAPYSGRRFLLCGL